jgi:hypothetical protein
MDVHHFHNGIACCSYLIFMFSLGKPESRGLKCTFLGRFGVGVFLGLTNLDFGPEPLKNGCNQNFGLRVPESGAKK